MVEPDEGSAVVEDARVTSEIRSNRHEISPADVISAFLLGGGFLIVVLLGLVQAVDVGAREIALLALLGLAHVIAGRVVFESTAGMAVATQPILVVAWLVLPPLMVPVVVAFGLLTQSRPRWSFASTHQLLVSAASGWHSLGAVIVLSIVDAEPSLSNWYWYALALAAQFVMDATVAAIRCLALGLRLGVLVQPLRWMYAIDVLLAPVGLTAVLAAGATGWAVLLAMSPVGVLALVSRDRVESFERAVTIGSAFEDAMNVARIDPLTGLPNRRAWNEAIANAALIFAADPTSKIVVIMSDLDGLKAINDDLGHEVGDRYLCAAADLFRRVVPPGARVARLGGDEFGILAVGIEFDGAAVVSSIRSQLADGVSVDGCTVSMSIGVASCPEAIDVESAVVLADERAIADKTARRVGRSR